jgi:hypothetical protein
MEFNKFESPNAAGSRFGDEKERGDKARQEAEARYAQAREEDYAKRDRVLNRLMGAETPKDVGAAIEIIKDYEDVQAGESIDRYTYGAYKRAAIEGQRAFEKGSKSLTELIDLGIVDENAVFDTAGRLLKGKVKASGYAIRIDPETQQVIFGSEVERLALAKAHENLHQILVTSEILQNQTELFDKTRASLENAVKYFYQDQLYFSNLQIKWFFTAADISKIDHAKPETLHNQELGKERDKAMRIYYLVGMSETREKMEEHLNTTYNLEEILGYNDDKDETLDRVVGLIKKSGSQKLKDELAGSGEMDKDQKFMLAAKFLIGEGLEVRKDEKGNWKYSLKGWLTSEERDPLSKTTKKKKDGKDYKKGGGSVSDESNEGARAYLTEVGNPYAEGSRDNLYMLMSRMNEIVGNDMAVTEGGRYFWTRGMRDELGLELYTDEKNLPTGEALLEYFNTHTFEEWEKYCEGIRKLYTITGEPVGSDLSKIFYPKMWRIKEMMLDRSAGPYLTYDKFEKLTQSELSLGRIKIEKDGIKENRSIREVWLGYKSSDSDPNEEAIDLGNIPWEQPVMPKELQEFVAGGGVEAGEAVKKEGGEPKLDLKAVTDNLEGYFWVMNYLAGDDNPAKRPWQFIMKGVERAGDFQKPEAYTDKIKFWKIIWHGPAVAWGNWRKEYKKTRGGQKRSDELIKQTEDGLDTKAQAMVNKGKKDWYTGIRSTVEYPTWANQPIKYLRYENGMLKAGTADLVSLIEGFDGNNPGLAVRYGFFDKNEINKPPQHLMKLYR